MMAISRNNKLKARDDIHSINITEVLDRERESREKSFGDNCRSSERGGHGLWPSGRLGQLAESWTLEAVWRLRDLVFQGKRGLNASRSSGKEGRVDLGASRKGAGPASTTVEPFGGSRLKRIRAGTAHPSSLHAQQPSLLPQQPSHLTHSSFKRQRLEPPSPPPDQQRDMNQAQPQPDNQLALCQSMDSVNTVSPEEEVSTPSCNCYATPLQRVRPAERPFYTPTSARIPPENNSGEEKHEEKREDTAWKVGR
ncbi:hypothetical protein AAG570_003237 [Ranatra chinensis]|uniref:Uncharacterized protein n=1 Tax=Ranatra chinensis TaxID=642074 RepID=A0ABD0Y6N9_9HEMI